MAQRPFIQTVHSGLDSIAPFRLAESSWDNVGLLIEAPPSKLSSELNSKSTSILCAIDLTKAVCDEAIECKAAALVLYHPPIFRPLKSLTLSKPLEASLLRCVANGISVWSVHTAADNASPHGTNDYVISLFRVSHHLIAGHVMEPSTVKTIKPIAGEAEGAGSGRLVTFEKPISIANLVQTLKIKLHRSTMQVAMADDKNPNEENVRTIAVCVGSGSSVFAGVEADVYLTGEMSHHEVLAANAAGTHVVLTNHSVMERPWLNVLKSELPKKLSELDPSRKWDVRISRFDREPLGSM